MALLPGLPSLRGALTTVTDLAAVGPRPAVLTAGLLRDPARAGTRAVRAAAVSGIRAVGTVVTGGDPLPGGHLHELAAVARGMVEPPPSRHTRRVWAGGGHAHVELTALAAEDAPELRAALRRQLQRLDGVEWATVNDVVGRVLVAFDTQRVDVEDVVGVVTAVEQARGGRPNFPQRGGHPPRPGPGPPPPPAAAGGLPPG